VRTKKSSKRQAKVVLREALEKMLARTEEFRKDVNQAVSDYSID
jgi:DNA-directed RNA polymerase subunit L